MEDGKNKDDKNVKTRIRRIMKMIEERKMKTLWRRRPKSRTENRNKNVKYESICITRR